MIETSIDAWAAHHDATAPRPVVERLREQEATIQRLIAQADAMGREIEYWKSRVLSVSA